jgi:hypothetical protein
MLEFLKKIIKLETLQNKKQLIIGDKEYDVIIRSKGKVGIQIGNNITDITKTVTSDPWQPRLYPISSKDFKQGTSSYTYQIDLKSFDTIACTWKLSDIDPLILNYSINIVLLAGYDWKTYNLHLDVMNDTLITPAGTITIDLNFLAIDGEDKFGFEDMPIPTVIPASKKANSRFFMFYYNPILKYWFNPIY